MLFEEELFCKGYARLFSDNKYIPEDIICLLIMFYRLFEEWLYYTKMKITKSDTIYFNDICECQTSGAQTVYGISDVSKGYHHWTLKLLKFNPNNQQHLYESYRIIVGITGSDHKRDYSYSNNYTSIIDNQYQFIWNYKEYNKKEALSGLAPDISNGYDKQYGQVGKQGDFIDIYLDFDQKTISFGINGKDYGVAFENIELGIYRLAVTLTGNGTSMQIMSYSHDK